MREVRAQGRRRSVERGRTGLSARTHHWKDTEPAGSFGNRVTNKEHRRQPDNSPRRDPSHPHSAGMSLGRCAQLGQPVELEQEVAELVETFRSELLSPCGLDLADGLSDHAHRSDAAWSESDAFRAKVVGIRSTLEIAEPFELTEQVVEGLLADP